MAERIVAPAEEPISLSEARDQCRIDDEFTLDDAWLKAAIVAARAAWEQKAQRSLITQTWRATFDAFPAPSMMGVPFGQSFTLPPHALLLERGPVQSIVSVQYTAMDGTTQTMSSADWALDTSTVPARMTPAFGKIWPITLPQIGAVRVTYVCGYGATSDAVPELAKAWIKLRVAAMYENREEIGASNLVAVPFAESLLDDFRAPVF